MKWLGILLLCSCSVNAEQSPHSDSKSLSVADGTCQETVSLVGTPYVTPECQRVLTPTEAVDILESVKTQPTFNLMYSLKSMLILFGAVGLGMLIGHITSTRRWPDK